MTGEDDAFALSGSSAPPTTNGELAFESPWQGRSFGMARALAEQGLYSWDEFRRGLIAEILRFEATPQGSRYAYYDRFLAALESLLVRRGVLVRGEVERRAEQLFARGDGHDHPHEHDH